MIDTVARIGHALLAAALMLCVTVRIVCEWLEPRMVRRLKRIGERITERNAA